VVGRDWTKVSRQYLIPTITTEIQFRVTGSTNLNYAMGPIVDNNNYLNIQYDNFSMSFSKPTMQMCNDGALFMQSENSYMKITVDSFEILGSNIQSEILGSTVFSSSVANIGELTTDIIYNTGSYFGGDIIYTDGVIGANNSISTYNGNFYLGADHFVGNNTHNYQITDTDNIINVGDNSLIISGSGANRGDIYCKSLYADSSSLHVGGITISDTGKGFNIGTGIKLGAGDESVASAENEGMLRYIKTGDDLAGTSKLQICMLEDGTNYI